MVIHELDEAFHYEGARVHDPHPSAPPAPRPIAPPSRTALLPKSLRAQPDEFNLDFRSFAGRVAPKYTMFEMTVFDDDTGDEK